MFLTACDIINKKKVEPDFNIKVIMDFEEERGSPNLPGAVIKYKKDLQADRMVILDGPLHLTNKPTLAFGARGISTVTLEVFGPKLPQHSGHYGNYIPNPAIRLMQLVGSMKDENGRVIIPGFYDGIEIDETALALMREVPDDESEILRKMGLAGTDHVANSLQEAIQYPSLNVRGMSSGWIGDKVRTIIPGSAVAEIDIRLVPESDPERLIGLIKSHIENKGYYITNGAPTDGEREKHERLISFDYRISYRAFRTPVESPVGLWLNAALARAFDDYPIRIRILGGSVPISPFVQTLGLPAVIVPTVNPDNNQHSPNENLRLGNLENGIRTILAILTEPIE